LTIPQGQGENPGGKASPVRKENPQYADRPGGMRKTNKKREGKSWCPLPLPDFYNNRFDALVKKSETKK
jgi:hypothetical protein